MVLGSITQSLTALVTVLKEHKLIAYSMLILVLATSGVVVNFFAVGNNYQCEFDNSTKETTLYDTELYNECSGIFTQGLYWKFNYTGADCENSAYAYGTEWVDACKEFVQSTQEASFLLDNTIPALNLFNKVSDWFIDAFGGDSSSLDSWYGDLFVNNQCTRLYNCMDEDKAESIGLFDGCEIKKGFLDIDDYPTVKEYQSVTRINLDEIKINEGSLEKASVFKVGCFGVGNDKNPTLKIFGVIPIFEWQFMLLLIVLYYMALFLLWFANVIEL